MNANRVAKSVAVSLGVVGVLIFLPYGARIHAQPSRERTHLTTDWSYKHMIYSKPGREEAMRKLEREPRYLQQQLRRHRVEPRREGADSLKRDWSVNLGATASVGALNYPAKFSFDITTASCSSDYVAFNTSTAGSSGQASVMAFNQLYSGCGAAPSVDWAYNTETAGVLSGIVSTSIVLSGDGSQVAFIDTPASGSASLVILKWAQGEGSTAATPVTPDQVFATSVYSPSNASSYSACKSSAGSCMLAWNVSGGGNDATSSPFYDYANDVMYVGDANGQIHKYTGVFNGVPAEVTTNWPVVLQSGTDQVASVVYDSVSGEVFASDADGFLYSVSCTQSSVSVPCSTSTAPAPSTSVTQSAQLAIDSGFVDGPIVDGAAGEIYLFAVNTNTDFQVAGVFQVAVGFGIGATGTFAGVDRPGGTVPLYAGDFDNNYYESEQGTSGQSPTGNLYVCGSPFGDRLAQVPITGGVIGGAHTVANSIFGSGNCSSVTEFFNPNGAGGAEDQIFFSITNGSVQNYSEVSNTSNCTGGGCLMSLVVSTWQPGTTYSVNQHILDSNLHEELVVVGGMSSGAVPSWPASPGSVTVDNGVQWEDQGPAANYVSWTSLQSSTPGTVILDNNGYTQLQNNSSCTTGATLPNWTEISGTLTPDGTCQWQNLGPAGMAGFGVTGGASGIVVDNHVSGIGIGSLPGASQIYFSILGSQTCGTGGAGGCAIQTSQSALR